MPVTVIGMVIAILLISVFATVEVVTTASGNIIPSSKVKILRSAQSGFVSQLNARNGQRVATGDLLVEVDDGNNRAVLRTLTVELNSTLSQLILYEAVSKLTLVELMQIDTNGLLEWLPESSKINILDRQWIVQRLVNLIDAINGIERDSAELSAERNYAITRALRAAEIEPLVKSNYTAKEKLVKKNYITQLENIESKISWQQARYDVVEYQQRKVLLDIRIASLQASIPEVFHRFQLEVSEQMQVLDLQRAKLTEQKSGVSALLDNTKTISPITGVIESLSITAEGVYVSKGDQLMSLVPIGEALIAEVTIPSKDIGFVRLGQRAIIKIDAFPFTRYGSLSGELIYLSRDARSESDGTELMYAGHLRLDAKSFATRDEVHPVQLGMSLEAEIITNKRSLIDFFIAPIKEALLSALRER